MASKVNVGIRITAEGIGQFKSNNRAAQVALDRTRKSALLADKGILSFGATVGRANGLLRTFIGVGVATGLVAITKGVADSADQYRILEARIKVATLATGDYLQVTGRLFAISQKNGTSLKETIKLFQNLSRIAPELDANNDQMLKLLDLVQKVGITSGASFDDMKFAMRQFSQSMASGIVRAEEFNSIVENTPELAFQIAKGMGLTVGQLRLAVVEGRVLSKEVFEAINKQGDEINLIFRGFPRSIEQARTALDAGFGRSFSKLNEELAFGTDEFVDVLDSLAESLATFAEDDKAIERFARDVELATKVGKVAVATFLTFKASGLIVGGFNALNLRLALTRAELNGISAEAIRAAGALNTASSVRSTSASIVAGRNAPRSGSVSAALGVRNAPVKQVSNLTTAMKGLKVAGAGALAVLGGWPGLLIAGGIAAATYAVSASSAADETEDWSSKLLELKGNINQLKLRDIDKAIESTQKSIAGLRELSGGPSLFSLIVGDNNEATQSQIQITKALQFIAILKREKADIVAAQAELKTQLGVDDNASSEFIAQLTKLLDAQNKLGKSKRELALESIKNAHVSAEEAKRLTTETATLYDKIDANERLSDSDKKTEQQRKQSLQQSLQFSQSLDKQIENLNQSTEALSLQGRALEIHNALMQNGLITREKLSAADQKRKQEIIALTGAIYDQKSAIESANITRNAALDAEVKQITDFSSIRRSLRTKEEAETEAHQARVQIILNSTNTGVAASVLDRENNRHLDAMAKIVDKGLDVKDTFGDMTQAINGWGAEFADAMLSADGSFKSFSESVIKQLAKIAIQQLSQPLLSFFGDFVSGAIGGSFGGSAALPSGGGAIHLSGTRASGGPVNGGEAYLVGEKGPEIIMPRGNGTVIPNNQISKSSGQSGGVTQYITIDARGAQPGMEQKIRAAAEDGARKGYMMVLDDVRRNGAIRGALA